MVERITGVAIVRKDGSVFSLPAPNRHHHCIHALAELGEPMPVSPREQGFVTNTGRYVDRKTAMELAEVAGQVNFETKGGDLYSEDLW